MNKGMNILKVSGIVQIVFAGISILLLLLALVGAGMFAVATYGYGVVVVIAVIVGLAQAGIELATGILAVKHCNNPEKAFMLFIAGAVCAVLCLVNLIVGGSGFLSFLIGLALPVLIMVGAYLNGGLDAYIKK